MKTIVALLFASAICAMAGTNNVSVTLAWDQHPMTNVVGYRVYWGAASRAYTNQQFVSGITNCITTITNLVKNTRYYFAATATNNIGLESDFSTEINWQYELPTAPTNLIIIKVMVETAASTYGPWNQDGEFALVRTNAPSGDGAFYRAIMGISAVTRN